MKNLMDTSSVVVALQLAILLLAASGAAANKVRGQREYVVYVGSAIYTGEESHGIYAFRFDGATGQLSPVGKVGEGENPSYLMVLPNHKLLYATNEIGKEGAKEGGWVSAYSIDRPTGKLTLLNKVPSGGSHPSSLAVDHTGKYVLVANYHGGTLLVFPILEDGKLGEPTAREEQHPGFGPNHERQEASHLHSAGFSPDNRFALTADLGLDKVYIYRFDSTNGSLTPNDPPFAKVAPGAGARHFAFSPSGKFLYEINELQSSLYVFSFDIASGRTQLLQTISTLPEGFKGENTAAEIQIHPSGKFLYASNRGKDDSIAVFAIDSGKGTLAPLEHVPCQGKTPRNFVLDPTGSWLLVGNQDSNNVVVFRIEPKTGRLSSTGHVGQAASPTYLEFLAIR